MSRMERNLSVSRQEQACLLAEIRDGSIDSNVPVATVLRKCMVLAKRLRTDDFGEWLGHELNGYPEKALLPDYRILNTQAFGHFVGFGGAQLQNAPIPPMSLPDALHPFLTTRHVYEPITTLEQLIRDSDGTAELRSGLPADLIAFIGMRVYQGYNCLAAWTINHRSVLVGIVDTVRNRILSLALKLEEELPDGGSGAAAAAAQVSQAFTTIVLGGVSNINTSGGSSVTTSTVVQGDVRSLRAFLLASGVPSDDIGQLEKAISSDREGHPGAQPPAIGSKVEEWLATVTKKVASGGWEIAKGLSVDLVIKAIRMYCGLGA